MIVGGRVAARRAAVAVEAAILLPTLVLLAVIAFDFCRVFHYATAVTDCARAGAIYASDPVTQSESPYGSVQAAALAEWPSGLGAPPTVDMTTTTEGGHAYADVTVRYTFRTVAAYAGTPVTVNLSRTVRVRVTQPLPNFS